MLKNILKKIPRRNTEAWKFNKETNQITIFHDDFFILNSSGSYIWQNIDGEHTIENIVHDCSSYFNMEKKVIQENVIEFLTEMDNKGFIELKIPNPLEDVTLD